MKKKLIALVLGFAPLLAIAQYDPEALVVLDAMSKKYKSLTSFEINFTTNLVNETINTKEESKAKITIKGDKFHLVLDDQEIFNNGTTVWAYLPEAKEVNIDNFDKNSDDINPSRIYEIYKKGFKYLHVEEKTEDGKLCDVIDLVPEKKDANYFKIRMSIVKKDNSIQSWTMFDRSGDRTKYTITKFTPNVVTDDSTFSFDPKKYPGVEVIDLR